MVKTKRLGHKIKTYESLNVFLDKLYHKGFEKLLESEYKEISKIANSGNIIYYNINPYDSEINYNKSIIFNNNKKKLENQIIFLIAEI